MDHIVLLEPGADMIAQIKSGKKTYVLRGGMGKKIPYGKLQEGETLYFAEEASVPEVQARATVSRLVQTDKLGREQSVALVSGFADKIKSAAEEGKYAGKRYLVLVEFTNLDTVEPFQVNRQKTEGEEDWLLARRIDLVKI